MPYKLAYLNYHKTTDLGNSHDVEEKKHVLKRFKDIVPICVSAVTGWFVCFCARTNEADLCNISIHSHTTCVRYIKQYL